MKFVIIYVEHACLSGPAMDLKAIDQGCDVTCYKLVVGWEDNVTNIQIMSRDIIKLQLSQHFRRTTR